MKNYMNRWVLLALKAIVILVWLACLWGQLLAVPGLSGALAGLYPSQTSMHWPYLIHYGRAVPALHRSGVRGRMETVLLVRLGSELEQVL